LLIAKSARDHDAKPAQVTAIAPEAVAWAWRGKRFAPRAGLPQFDDKNVSAAVGSDGAGFGTLLGTEFAHPV
jgi:hypothetical protein